MALFDSRTARTAAYKRNLRFIGKGRYIVAYQLFRKNAARHVCFRSESLEACKEFIRKQKYLDRYYKIYDYNWKEVEEY